MSLMDRRQKRIVPEQQHGTSPLPMPGLIPQDTPVEQLPFPDNPTLPVASVPLVTTPQAQQFQHTSFNGVTQTQSSAPAAPQTDNLPPSPGVTRVLVDLSASAHVTRQLTEIQTGTLPPANKSTTTNLRQPVIIRGTGKKSTGAAPPPRRRRMVVHVAVTALLVFIVLSALIVVIPVGTEGHTGNYGVFQPIMNLVNANSNNTGLIAQQAATATAVTQDGYDPGGNRTYAGVQSGPAAPVTAGSTLNRFFYGQCTYWANMRYHALTGFWVPWLGNANAWAYGAAQSGWVVSPTPKVPSIIVLQAYVQGAGYYGHVAVVEKINADGSVLTSNYNWAGNWARETWVTFRPGPGVSFVWHP